MAQDDQQAANLHLAKQGAKLFTSQMMSAGVPVGVQLMTVELIAKAIFLHDVQPAKRLELFDAWSKAIRDDVKKRKTDGKA